MSARESNPDNRTFELRVVGILLTRELREAWRNRWFLLYTLTFASAALTLSWMGQAAVSSSGFSGLERTAASLVNLVVLVVPLMGLTLASGSLAAEREMGSLAYLMAHPVGYLEVIIGKLLGLAAATIAALLIGFGVAAIVIGRGGGDSRTFVVFLVLSALVAVASVSLGLAISSVAPRAVVANGIALFAWLALVIISDLGLLGTSLVMRLEPGQLLGAALVNPLQEFKIASILLLRGGLESLGPAGLYASHRFGAALLPLLIGCLVMWTIVPTVFSWRVLRSRGAV